MEIYIQVKYDEINPLDFSKESDSLFRGIQEKFPNAIWEKSGLWFKVTTLD